MLYTMTGYSQTERTKVLTFKPRGRMLCLCQSTCPDGQRHKRNSCSQTQESSELALYPVFPRSSGVPRAAGERFSPGPGNRSLRVSDLGHQVGERRMPAGRLKGRRRRSLGSPSRLSSFLGPESPPSALGIRVGGGRWATGR